MSLKAQYYESDKQKLVSFLSTKHQLQFREVDIDYVFDKFSALLNIKRDIFQSGSLTSIFYKPLKTVSIQQLFFAPELDTAFIKGLPLTFFNDLLVSKEMNTKLLYLLLKNSLNDTTAIANFIKINLDENLDIEAKRFIYQLYMQLFHRIYPTAIISNKNYEENQKTDYKRLYKAETYVDINPGEDPELNFLNDFKRLSITLTDEAVITASFKKTSNNINKLMLLDVAATKFFSISNFIDQIFSLNVKSSIKMKFLQIEYQRALVSGEVKYIEEFIKNLFVKYCKKYPLINSKIDITTAEEYNMHTQLIDLLLQNENAFTDSLILSLQRNIDYDYYLFYKLVKKKHTIENDFFKRHLEIFFANTRNKSNVKFVDLDSISNTNASRTGLDYSDFLPERYYYKDQFIMSSDSVFEKLFTTKKYSDIIEAEVLKIDSVKTKLKKNPVEQLSNMINADEYLKGFFAWRYLFMKKPKLLPKLISLLSDTILKKEIFNVASLFNFNDKKNYLIKYLEELLPVDSKNTNRIRNYEAERALIHYAKIFFVKKANRRFVNLINRLVSDTNNIYRSNIVLLGSYPYMFQKFPQYIQDWYFNKLNDDYNWYDWAMNMPQMDTGGKNIVRGILYKKMYKQSQIKAY